MQNKNNNKGVEIAGQLDFYDCIQCVAPDPTGGI